MVIVRYSSTETLTDTLEETNIHRGFIGLSKDFDSLFCFITPQPAPNDMTVKRALRLVYKLYLADRS